jgi:surface protein
MRYTIQNLKYQLTVILMKKISFLFAPLLLILVLFSNSIAQTKGTDPMVLEFNTALSTGTTVAIPLYGTVNVTVDWGDGTTETYTTEGKKNHTYAVDGIYTVNITGTLTRYGFLWFDSSHAEKLVRVTSFGDLGITSLNGAFSFALNLIEVPATIPSSVTDIGYMFLKARSFNGDLSSWDVSQVTQMGNVFEDASSFNGDLSTWNLGNVTLMTSMFRNATTFNSDISAWNVSQVTDMTGMFSGATAFNGNLGAWDVTSVISMDTMFMDMALSVENYDALLNGWSTLNLQNDFWFDAGNSKYSAAGAAARQYIIDTYNWGISDGGLVISTVTDYKTACNSFTWIDGITYTQSNNSASYTLVNSEGGDSIVTLNLTINKSTTGIDIQTACDTYTWLDGITYTQSNNTATHTLTNAAGCDSIVTLNLTINNRTAGIDVQSACDSYKWIDGLTYTKSNNTATHTLRNATGCDSVVTLNLTINKSTSSVQNITAINSYTWIDSITYTVNNNTATHTILNKQGCDSVITLNLTITVPIEPLKVTVNAKNVKCFGESTGTATLLVVGGVAPYSYKWSNGSTSQNQTGLSAGNYVVTVSDAKEGKSIKEITISQPSMLLTVSAISDHVKCKSEATGSITLQVEGGNEPYIYKWSNGFITKNISQVKANTYTVTVVDSNECKISNKYTISQPANALMVYGINKKSDCNGDATGEITLTVSGGVQPYSYNWSNGSAEKDQALLAIGDYGVTVTDTNQCTTVWNTSMSQQSKATLTGIAKYSGGVIEAGDASVYLYDIQYNMNDSVWEVRIQDNGVFEFANIPEGQYYIYVKLDENVKQKYKDVSHTYYKQTFKWNEAKTFDLSCGDISSIVLNMIEIPASVKGTSSVSGIVVKDNKGLKSSFPPIENIDVMLINLLTNAPVASVETDKNGYYEFGEIAEGNYALYINIPGINQNSTYTFSVYKQTTNFSNLDFEIDMDEDFEYNTINFGATNIESSFSQFDLVIYPNPANNYVIISSDYIKNKEAEITLVSNLGVVIQKQKLYAGESHQNEFKFELLNVVSGSYILKIDCEKSVSIKNIIVIK